MDTYIPDYEIPVLERQAREGDRDAIVRLMRFYDGEIASLTTRRDALRAMLYQTADEQQF